MLHGRLFAIAFTSKLRTEFVESKRLPVPVDPGSFSRSSFDGAESGACQALHLPLRAEPDEPGLRNLGSLLDRGENHFHTTCHSVAAQEPASSRDHPRNKQKEEGGDEHDAESDRRQHPGQQEPDSRERKSPRTQLVPIDRLERLGPRH